MFKFFKRLFLCATLIITVVIGAFCYNTYKNYNTLIKNLDTVSLSSNSSVKDSSNKSNSYLDHPSLNPSTIVEDDSSSIESNSLEDITSNYTIDVKDIEISQEIGSIAEVNDILSNEESFDLAIKLNDINALVSLDNSNNKISVLKFDGDGFNSLKNITDKYINVSLDKYDSVDSIKNEFMNANLFGKYDLFSKVLKNSDTNLSESDIFSLYFSSLSK